MKNNKKRFKVIIHEADKDGSGTKVIEDTDTGVTYLYHYGHGGAGLTVLRDDEGEPDFAPEK